ncbi:MAG TPA: hypothetical protein PKC39_13845 [Ferruginibacter sp.]|nr:hypothetical protein [Ferruginibacter sp.]HMP22039.1 hypothetical protein [Ferruginibacter sp.]
MFPLPANIYAEIAAFAASVIFWSNIKTSVLRWLCPFLLFIVMVELTGRYIYKELHVSNAWLYNISVPAEYLFYTMLFYFHYSLKYNRILAKGFLLIFPVWVVVSILFINGFYTFNFNFLKTGSICISFFCLLYFYEVLTSEAMLNPFKQPMFWIACGLFLFNAGEFAYNSFADILMKKWSYGKKLFSEINNNLIFVLYSAIIIAIVLPSWAHREQT